MSNRPILNRFNLPFLIAMLGTSLLLSAVARAELHVEEDAEDQQGLRVYRMTVTPAAEPDPPLKYRFTYLPTELRQGNAPLHYTRVHAENTLQGTMQGLRREFGEEFYDWITTDYAISELPLEKVDQAARMVEKIVEEFIRPGAMSRDRDWELGITELRGEKVISFLLPEFQGMRELMRILMLKTRAAIAHQQYDKAIDYLRMNYQLSRDTGSVPFLVCGLVGIAGQSMAHFTIADLIAASDSPNLYWALAELPQPLIDLRESMRMEMSFGTRIFPVLIDIQSAEHSTEQWADKLQEVIVSMESIAGDAFHRQWPIREQNVPGFTSTLLSLVVYPKAKSRLIESGMDPAEVKEMAVGHVVLLDAAREYRRAADHMEKGFYIPHPHAEEVFDEVEDFLIRASREGGLGGIIAGFLLPATSAVHNASARTQWRHNALMVIEALRMHAAERGKFPASLDEIEVVPVPQNPVTGKPYEYHLDGEMAVLELPFSDGIRGYAMRFEIQLAE